MRKSPLILLAHLLVIALGAVAAWVTVEQPGLAASVARWVYAGLGLLILVGIIASALRSGDEEPHCDHCGARLNRFSGISFCYRCGEESGRNSPS